MPVKVLMFGWELPPFNSGGLGTACYGLTRALADQGVEVTFVLPKNFPLKADHMRLVFADLPDFDWTKFTAYSTTPGLQVLDLEHLPPDLVSVVFHYAKRAGDIAKKIQHDLIHAHDWLCFPAGSVAANRSGRPFISHVHATEFDRSGGHAINPSVYEIEKRTMAKASKVIAVSNFTKNLLTQAYRADPAKIAVVHNGVNLDEFNTSPEADALAPLKAAGFKVVTYIGRLTLQKGVDYFIKAAHLVIKTNPKVVFLVIGSGDMEGQLISEVASLGISDHFLFGGFLRGTILKSVYKSSDLFVMPSVSEPFGLTALESIASGTPAIISIQSGASEVVRHALKVNFWDIEEMANQILAVVSHSSLHQTLKTNGLVEVQKNTWAAAAAKVIKVYQEVLNK